MDSSRSSKEMTFFGAFLWLIVAPPEAARLLVQAKKYHFAVLMLALLLVVAFAPMAISLYAADHLLYRLDVLKSFVLGSTIAFFLFIFLEAVLLRVLGIKLELAGLISVICYATAPIIFLVLVVYVLNYWASGSASYLTFVLNGYASLNQGCVTGAFWATTACVIVAGLILTYGLKYLGDLYTLNAVFLTLLSLIPLLTAFVLSIILADTIVPGTINIYRQLLTTPSFILTV